jgi:Holliday junction DNA helicase RuvA
MTSGGVGYQVWTTINTLAMLQPEQQITVFVETQVREDHIHLFGFTTASEKAWFNLLCTVQGVGAKVALSILSTLTTSQLYNAIAFSDKDLIATANGVGPKMAVRITSELKDKLGKLSTLFKTNNGIAADIVDADYKASEADANSMIAVGEMRAEAVAALVNLGYKKVDATEAVTNTVKKMLTKDDAKNISVSDLIREALKSFKV